MRDPGAEKISTKGLNPRSISRTGYSLGYYSREQRAFIANPGEMTSEQEYDMTRINGGISSLHSRAKEHVITAINARGE
jgi:hypothetical protein